ncbi:hypothetical protein [Carnobacterium gallinarum]|uniref:hypothetical protein n=1 Tax=Carnobacterium gallinarum TaxID=2749 RepID=UPI00146FF1A9|nr:hypothetical protein [Carnobacterium gallinarum]
MISLTKIIDYLLTLDAELNATYLYYQEFVYTFKQKISPDFQTLLVDVPYQVSSEMKTSVKP